MTEKELTDEYPSGEASFIGDFAERLKSKMVENYLAGTSAFRHQCNATPRREPVSRDR